MTKLLVSVRNVAEALTALDAGVDLIDVKEPDRGALGAADATTIAAVVAAVDNQRPTSAALGELTQLAVSPAWLPPGLCYAKLGLAGCARRQTWHDSLRAAIETFPIGVAAVVVAYADWQLAVAPPPWEILSQAKELGCRGVLLDTFEKQRGTLRDYFSTPDLRRWLGSARKAGLMSVVAGGLVLDDTATIAQLEPDYVGVRGAACDDGRRGTIDRRRVRQLLQALCRVPVDVTQS